jgi:Co/Zn/Cd efflux system component
MSSNLYSLVKVNRIDDIGGMSDTSETTSVASGRQGLGLTLIEPILGAATVIAIGLTVREFGWQWLLTYGQIGIAFLAFVFLWSKFARVAPGATKTISVIAVFGVLISTVACAWLLESREAARSNRSQMELKKISAEFERDLYLRPPTRGSE